MFAADADVVGAPVRRRLPTLHLQDFATPAGEGMIMAQRPLLSASRFDRIAVLSTLFALVALLLVPASPAAAVEDVQPARVDGATRLETAAAIAHLSYPDGVPEAVVADSTTFATALSAAGLAGALDAPVLLTPPTFLAATTAEALSDLRVERVTVVGDESNISSDVAMALEQNYDVTRIGGGDAIASAALIARTTASVRGTLPTTEGVPTVMLATAGDFGDALSLSGPAHDGGFPLLLTDSDTLSDEAALALEEIQPGRVIVAGGPDAVAEAVLADIEERGIDTVRLGGRTRTETATLIADYFVGIGYLEARIPLLARGDAFPDALTAGTLSSVLDGPILLTATQGLLSEETGSWFTANCPTIEVLQIVGGRAAVSVDVANSAEAQAESCGDDRSPTPVSGQTFRVTPQQALEAAAPTSFDFTVADRVDDQPFTGPIDLILFPCASANVTGAGPDRFADRDGDGAADGFASTNTGNARIAVVNGTDVDDTTIFLAAPDEDGDVDVRLASQDADCTVLVAVTGNGNGQLDLDDDGRPVEEYGVARARWTDPATATPGGQTYEVSPQEPVTPAPGDVADFTALQRYEGAPLEESLDIVLFPCATADVLGSDPDTFLDADGDGGADGFASTDTGSARIAVVNGIDIVDDTVVAGVGPDEDGDLDVRLASADEDCTVMVIVRGNGNGQLDVDVDGRPLEPYGVGLASWQD